MSLIVGLIIIAFSLFFIEIFVPGGILAVIGGILLLVASVLTYQEYGLQWALGLLFFGLIGSLVMFFLEIRIISSSRLGQQFALKTSISAKLNPKADDNLVGRDGVTLTAMAPSGKVEIDGISYTASAEDGFLEKGVPIRVIRTETFKLIVIRS